MLGLGFLGAWLGYSIFYVGLSWVTGGCNGFLEMTVPGKWSGTVCKDAAGSSNPNAVQTPAGSPSTTPGGSAETQLAAWEAAHPNATAAQTAAEASSLGIVFDTTGGGVSSGEAG
jgi:hypothetical protein